MKQSWYDHKNAASQFLPFPATEDTMHISLLSGNAHQQSAQENEKQPTRLWKIKKAQITLQKAKRLFSYTAPGTMLDFAIAYHIHFYK